MNGFFITGTDTNVGKTLTAAMLTAFLGGCYWKPIQSGMPSDRERVQQLTGLPDAHFYPSQYTLKASLSPDQAAELEGITIDLTQCQLPKTAYPLIVEGAGGVFVPINQNECMLDLMQQLALPVIVVSRGTLGTVNHTLLTLEALRKRQLDIEGIVFSGELNPANQTAIETWGKVKTLFHIPFIENWEEA